MTQTKTYTIVETITESFNAEVPAHLEGDELGEYLENERANGDHARQCRQDDPVNHYTVEPES